MSEAVPLAPAYLVVRVADLPNRGWVDHVYPHRTIGAANRARADADGDAVIESNTFVTTSVPRPRANVRIMVHT